MFATEFKKLHNLWTLMLGHPIKQPRPVLSFSWSRKHPKPAFLWFSVNWIMVMLLTALEPIPKYEEMSNVVFHSPWWSIIGTINCWSLYRTYFLEYFHLGIIPKSCGLSLLFVITYVLIRQARCICDLIVRYIDHDFNMIYESNCAKFYVNLIPVRVI